MRHHFTPLGSRGTTTRYLALDARGILNPPAATGMRFWSLNPYVGCEFGCAYCYARETHRWTIDRAANQWTVVRLAVVLQDARQPVRVIRASITAERLIAD